MTASRSASPAHRWRRAFALATAVAVMAVAASPAAARPVSVVTSTSILADITTRIGGDAAAVRSLIPVGADPHQFALSARQAAELRRADLVVVNGLGLEAGLAPALEAARRDGARIVEIGNSAVPRPGPGGRVDPHIWTDPVRMERIATAIGAQLRGRADSAAARAAIDRRTAAYRRTLLREDARIRRALAPLPPRRRVLVTNHHVLGYFAHRYRLRVVGAVIPSTTTLASASAADLAGLTRTIRRSGARAIFVDSSSPRRLADALAREAGTRVRVISLYSESLGPRGSGADSYLGMLRTNARRIQVGLGG